MRSLVVLQGRQGGDLETVFGTCEEFSNELLMLVLCDTFFSFICPSSTNQHELMSPPESYFSTVGLEKSRVVH